LPVEEPVQAALPRALLLQRDAGHRLWGPRCLTRMLSRSNAPMPSSKPGRLHFVLANAPDAYRRCRNAAARRPDRKRRGWRWSPKTTSPTSDWLAEAPGRRGEPSGRLFFKDEAGRRI